MEIPVLERLVCSGCGRNYDSKADLAPLHVGTDRHELCKPCYVTSAGAQHPITFEEAQANRR